MCTCKCTWKLKPKSSLLSKRRRSRRKCSDRHKPHQSGGRRRQRSEGVVEGEVTCTLRSHLSLSLYSVLYGAGILIRIHTLLICAAWMDYSVKHTRASGKARRATLRASLSMNNSEEKNLHILVFHALPNVVINLWLQSFFSCPPDYWFFS